MKVHFHPFDGPVREAEVPPPGAASALVEGTCPACGAKAFHAAGLSGTMVRGHDTYTSRAACVDCREEVGKLVVTVDTLFGIEEDERVLRGRCRVY